MPQGVIELQNPRQSINFSRPLQIKEIGRVVHLTLGSSLSKTLEYNFAEDREFLMFLQQYQERDHFTMSKLTEDIGFDENTVKLRLGSLERRQ